jgi:hypothetical protein
MTSSGTPDRDRRDAMLAAVLAQGVREERLLAADALRVLRHEMRRRNTNRTTSLSKRSQAAQEVNDRYEAAGNPVPKNASHDALHADHVHALTVADLHRSITVDDWMKELVRLREVVCVTARENYRLQQVERMGITGPAKYVEAGVVLLTES